MVNKLAATVAGGLIGYVAAQTWEQKLGEQAKSEPGEVYLMQAKVPVPIGAITALGAAIGFFLGK